MNYSQKERDWIEVLEGEYGFAAQRAPASGGATDRDLPDVIAGRPIPIDLISSDTVTALDAHYAPIIPQLSETWAFEVKYRGKERAYFPKEDLVQLSDYATKWGATPRVACRFNANKTFAYGDTNWYLMRPDQFHTTETKARIDYDDVTELAMTAEELLGKAAEPGTRHNGA